MSEEAKLAVKAIIEDLSDRKGLGDEWGQIDEETLAEIESEWIKLIDIAIGGNVK